MAISTPADIGTTAPGGTGSSLGLTTTAAVPAGGKIFVAICWFGSQTLSSVSDGTNTYTIDKTQTTPGTTNCRFAIASADAPSGLASGSTITATWSGTTADRKIAAAYSTGVQTGAGAAYGAVGQGQSNNTAWSSTTTTVNNGDLLWGGCHWEDGVVAVNTPSGGNTELHEFGPSGNRCVTCYQFGTGAAIAAQGTWDSAAAIDGTASIAVAYTAASGGTNATVTAPAGPGTATAPAPTIHHPPYSDAKIGSSSGT